MNEQQGVRLAYVELGNARIELMEPSRPDSPISKFLEHHPAGGIHHFCLDVDEVMTTAAAIAGKGARVLGDGGRDPQRARRTHRFRASEGLLRRIGGAGRARK